MKEEVEFLDEEKNWNKKWRCLAADCTDSCCGFQFQEARIFIREILPLSQYFPLSFNILNCPDGKAETSLSIFLRAPLGIAPCVYLREGEGCSLGEERPIACRLRPFCAIKDRDGRYRAGLKPSCPGFSEQDGLQLLMPDNTVNPVIYQECIKPAISAAEMEEETQIFVDTLSSHDLIAVGCCEHRGEKIYMHIVNAQKLYALPGQIIDEFRSKGYMDLILAHINSSIHYRRFIDAYLERKARL